MLAPAGVSLKQVPCGKTVLDCGLIHSTSVKNMVEFLWFEKMNVNVCNHWGRLLAHGLKGRLEKTRYYCSNLS
jgi:hypothetical protein